MYHIDRLTENLHTMQLLVGFECSPEVIEKTKKKIFHHYYGATRDIIRRDGEFKIKVDEPMIKALHRK